MRHHMDILKQKGKWLWPLGRVVCLLPVSFKECDCVPSHPFKFNHVAPQGRPPVTCNGHLRAIKHCRVVPSLAWLAYSLATVAGLVTAAIVALYLELQRARRGVPSTRLTTMTDELVFCCDIVSVSATAAVCILQAACSPGALGLLLDQLHQVDSLLSVQAPAAHGCLALWLVFLAVVEVVDITLWAEVEQDFAIANYLPFYVLYFSTFVMEALFIDDAHGIHVRLVTLNRKLEATLATSGDKGTPTRVATSERAGGRQRALTSTTSFQQLSAAHALLCEATQSVARRYCVSLLADMLCLLLHFVCTAYYVFQHYLLKPANLRVGRQAISGQYVVWLVAHLARMIMIVLPCSRAKAEASRTGTLVGMVLNTSSHATLIHKQLEVLSIQLLHHRVSFNACGLFELGLPLVTSILGAVTTHLVVLLQIKAGPLVGEAIGNVTGSS